MSPVLSPSLSSSSLARKSPSIATSLSTAHTFTEIANPPPTLSLRLPTGDTDLGAVAGLRHAKSKLEARYYKTSLFANQLLDCLRCLHVPSWTNNEITPQTIQIHKVSGSLTNAVFFVSCPSVRATRTVLLRIYGPSSGSLISRPQELRILHALSSQYHIGPRVYGTFENGRVEEYFESTTLSPFDIRDPKISRWIGARMAELHSVDIEVIEGSSSTKSEGKGREIGVKKNVKSWLDTAQSVLALPSISDAIRNEFNLKGFREDWDRYMRWLARVDDVSHGSRRVFSHNDAQYGNLLRLKHLKEGFDEHHQIIVVDFEYASLNPASFDIANHFHEWTANYHTSVPHLLDPSRYPTFEERRNFYITYLTHSAAFGEDPVADECDRQLQVANLEEQVRIWSPASHAMWAIWGIVQAREDVEGDVKEPEFDYISYARGRIASFRRELRALRI